MYNNLSRDDCNKIFARSLTEYDYHKKLTNYNYRQEMNTIKPTKRFNIAERQKNVVFNLNDSLLNYLIDNKLQFKAENVGNNVFEFCMWFSIKSLLDNKLIDDVESFIKGPVFNGFLQQPNNAIYFTQILLRLSSYKEGHSLHSIDHLDKKLFEKYLFPINKPEIYKILLDNIKSVIFSKDRFINLLKYLDVFCNDEVQLRFKSINKILERFNQTSFLTTFFNICANHKSDVNLVLSDMTKALQNIGAKDKEYNPDSDKTSPDFSSFLVSKITKKTDEKEDKFSKDLNIDFTH